MTLPSTEAPPPVNVFAASMDTSLDTLSPEFAQGLSLLALYVNTHGGVPAQTTVFRGFALGKWYTSHRRRPGLLSEFERASLLAIPAVALNDFVPRPGVATSGRGRDRERAWARVYSWACHRQQVTT